MQTSLSTRNDQIFSDKEITTPCGTWAGVDRDEEEACAVSIIRAGDSMLEAVRSRDEHFIC